tara:strand:- start:1336 stop:2985 length:1650 start_codon:yes stop_codon:yes gene_type:complete
MVKDKDKINKDSKKNLPKPKTWEGRWMQWVKTAPLQALKLTTMWAILGGNIVLLTSKSKTWPFDKELEKLLLKRKKAIEKEDIDLKDQLNAQLEEEGVMIDEGNNSWSFKEFTGELDSGCYRIPISLDELYEDWFPTDPNSAPYCLQDDMPPNPTQSDDFSVVDLIPPMPGSGGGGGEDDEDDDSGIGGMLGKLPTKKGKVKQRGGRRQRGGASLLGIEKNKCKPRDTKSPAEIALMKKKCGKRGKCPPPEASCMGGEAYACLQWPWSSAKFWSEKTTPEKAQKYLDSFRTDDEDADTTEDPEKNRFRPGWKIFLKKLQWFLVKWGHYIKRCVICMFAGVIIGFRIVLKTIFNLLSGGGSSDSPSSSSCKSVKRTSGETGPQKEPSNAMQFWGGAIAFAVLMGILPFKLGIGPSWLTPFAVILILCGLLGGLGAAPIIFLFGGYLLFAGLIGPIGTLMPVLLAAFLLIYPIMVFSKHGGYFTPLLKNIGNNFWGLTALFVILTGIYTENSNLTKWEKYGVYGGIAAFAGPALFKQFTQKPEEPKSAAPK